MNFERVEVACVLLFNASGEQVLMVQDNGSWGFPGGGRELPGDHGYCERGSECCDFLGKRG